MKIKYKFGEPSTTIKDAKYSFHIPGILSDYADKFDCLTSVEVVIRENLVVYNGGAKTSSIKLTGDLKSCTIDLPINFYEKKNQIQAPEPNEFFLILRSCIERSDKEYIDEREKFDICDRCKGKGKITTIFDTQVDLSGQRVTIDSTIGPTEDCPNCRGTGFVRKPTP